MRSAREHPEFLRELGARSYLSVPLRGRKGVIGALSLVRGLPGRRYGAEDVAVAEGLGQRAGLAVENARLYRAAREAVDRARRLPRHRRPRAADPALDVEPAAPDARRRPAGRSSTRRSRPASSSGPSSRRAASRASSTACSRCRASRQGGSRSTARPTDLSAIALDVAQRLRGAAEAAGCAVTVHAGRPVTGTWDPLRMDQVVTNLLQNAIRYAPGGPIELTVEEARGQGPARGTRPRSGDPGGAARRGSSIGSEAPGRSHRRASASGSTSPGKSSRRTVAGSTSRAGTEQARASSSSCRSTAHAGEGRAHEPPRRPGRRGRLGPPGGHRRDPGDGPLSRRAGRGRRAGARASSGARRSCRVSSCSTS